MRPSPAALGTFGFDDEGVPAQRTVIVDRGIFIELPDLARDRRAIRRGQQRHHAGRWLEPNPAHPHDEHQPGTGRLVAGRHDRRTPTEGVYLQTNRSWSIDDKRLNFQFGTEIAWEIKDGKLGAHAQERHLYRHHAALLGRLRRRLASEWTVWGTPNCGKGQPSQAMHVGHGAAPIRVRNVQIGVMR